MRVVYITLYTLLLLLLLLKINEINTLRGNRATGSALPPFGLSLFLSISKYYTLYPDPIAMETLQDLTLSVGANTQDNSILIIHNFGALEHGLVSPLGNKREEHFGHLGYMVSRTRVFKWYDREEPGGYTPTALHTGHLALARSSFVLHVCRFVVAVVMRNPGLSCCYLAIDVNL